jgi:uncharacterized membrane protein
LGEQLPAGPGQSGRRAVLDVDRSGVSGGADVFARGANGQISEVVAVEVVEEDPSGQSSPEQVTRLRVPEVEAQAARSTPTGVTFSNFPAFMPDVQEVTTTGPMTSHWKVSGPLGKSLEWDAEIVDDIANQRIAWRSVGDADNAGAVRFDESGATTNIEVSLVYNPPGGKAGELVAELVKDPDKQIQRAVGNFRMVVERGGLVAG